MPVEISNITELQAIENDLTGDYILVNDIDASDTENWNGGDGFNPIGGQFDGTLDGNNYSVTGLYINRSGVDSTCLIKETSSSANSVIKNLHLKDVDIRGGRWAAPFVGRHRGGHVHHCSATGNVNHLGSGKYLGLGGLIGRVEFNSLVEWCWSKVDMDDNDPSADSQRVGGIIGDVHDDSIIRNCFYIGNIGNLNSNHYVGGLAGLCIHDFNGYFEKCFAIVNMKNGVSRAGGLIGEHRDGEVKDCYAIGSIETADPDNTQIAGGTGRNDGGTYTNCYAVVTVNANDHGHIGGFIGNQLSGSVSNCFWDSDVEPKAGQEGTPKTTSEMQTLSTFSAWDIASKPNLSTEKWFLDVGNDYPRFEYEYSLIKVFDGTDWVEKRISNFVNGRFIENEIKAFYQSSYNLIQKKFG